MLTPRQLFTHNWRSSWLGVALVASAYVVWATVFSGTSADPAVSELEGLVFFVVVMGQPVLFWLACYVLLCTTVLARLPWVLFRVATLLTAATFPFFMSAFLAISWAHPALLALAVYFGIVTKGYAPIPSWATVGRGGPSLDRRSEE